MNLAKEKKKENKTKKRKEKRTRHGFAQATYCTKYENVQLQKLENNNRQIKQKYGNKDTENQESN
jgi:hypothetical protein